MKYKICQNSVEFYDYSYGVKVDLISLRYEVKSTEEVDFSVGNLGCDLKEDVMNKITSMIDEVADRILRFSRRVIKKK